MKKSQICTTILAGGNSTRMGSRKELLEWDGQPLLHYLADTVRKAGFPCVIVSNEQTAIGKETLLQKGVHIVSDKGASHGPISGIAAAISGREEEFFLVLSCDLPFIGSDHLIQLADLASELTEYDAVIPETQGCLQPLFALYHRRTKEMWESALANGNFRIMATVEKMRVKQLHRDWLDDWVTFNMNTPEHYQIALQEKRRRDSESSQVK